MVCFCEDYTALSILALGDPTYDPANPHAYFPAPMLASPQMIRLKAGDNLLREGFPAEHVYILLQGSAQVLVHSSTGKMVVVESAQAPHVFGATEAIAQHRLFGATVQANSSALVAKLTTEAYLHVIQTNLEAANVTVKYMALLAVRNMDKCELKAITRPIEILVRYLYMEAQMKELPYTVHATRESISNELHINLRTLYRYIDRLEAQGFLYVHGAKMVIDQGAFDKLKAEFMKRDIME